MARQVILISRVAAAAGAAQRVLSIDGTVQNWTILAVQLFDKAATQAGKDREI